MRYYPDQPEEKEVEPVDKMEFATYIRDFLTEELPQCTTNEWFIKGVHLANMVDKLVEELGEKFFP